LKKLICKNEKSNSNNTPIKMNTQLKYQIQERFPQCRCEDEFGTDNNPYNERCSICDEGASGVADKIAKATKLCVEKTTKAFSNNWDLELKDFMRNMEKEHLEAISYYGNPSDLLDWFESEPESEYTNFEWMAMNLRLHKDKEEMLGEIIDKANEELWEMREIERKEKEKEKENQPEKITIRRIIKKKVPTKI